MVRLRHPPPSGAEQSTTSKFIVALSTTYVDDNPFICGRSWLSGNLDSDRFRANSYGCFMPLEEAICVSSKIYSVIYVLPICTLEDT